MAHQRQGLSVSLEAGNDLAASLDVMIRGT